VDLVRRAVAEALGTAFLLIAVVGGGIMASMLSPGDIGLQLLAAALVTSAALVAVILAFGPVSGAHLNPAVSLAARLLGGLDDRELAAYVGAQLVGAAVGVVLANLMFDLPAVTIATTERTGTGQWLGEVIATLGLVLVIFGMVRDGAGRAVAVAVGTYIAAAYFFTSSTSFANPAVTISRTLTDSFAGIGPQHVPGFLVAQVIGVGLAVVLVRFLYPGVEEVADEAVLPHDGTSERAAALD
jgi:glycerol uptake facilitator-like aquaporin